MIKNQKSPFYWFKQHSYLNLCVLVIPSTIVSHANGPFLRFNESASFPFFKVILSSFDVAFLGKGEHLVVCANSKWANHFNLWWGKIWLRSLNLQGGELYGNVSYWKNLEFCKNSDSVSFSTSNLKSFYNARLWFLKLFCVVKTRRGL